MLVFPTIKHLEQLARFRTVSDVLEHARASRVLPVEPRVLVDGGVARCCCRARRATTMRSDRN